MLYFDILQYIRINNVRFYISILFFVPTSSLMILLFHIVMYIISLDWIGPDSPLRFDSGLLIQTRLIHFPSFL